MSEEALKQDDMIEEGGEIVDLEDSVEKTEETVAVAPEPEVVEEVAEPEVEVADKRELQLLRAQTKIEPTTGIEPATFCLRSRRSTAKLHWRADVGAPLVARQPVAASQATWGW